jgi:UDP-N-acetylmuramate dehydrogenase
MDIQKNISLKPFNTFGMEVIADYFSAFNSVETLQKILSNPLSKQLPVMVLGGGSNVLLTANLEMLVLKNEITGIELVDEDDQYFYVKAGSGVNWHHFVLYCIDHNYAGVENLALIPGSVGASPMQNIGAYGVEIKDVFHSLEAVDMETNNVVIFYNSDCKFGYRESVFKNELKNKFVITSVTYRLNKIPNFNISYGAIATELAAAGITELSIKAIAEAVINIRKSKLPDPLNIGNAGSFFKNPEIDTDAFESLKKYFPTVVGHPTADNTIKVAAGWLIEQAGWKGFRDGDAGCYEKQALVLVNYGNATGSEIFILSEKIISSVHQKFGIYLHREVNVY